MENGKLRICSLFAGAGGIDYAFEQAGCTTVWANENDRDACATYHLNFPFVPLDRRDIRQIPLGSIPDFDLLVGGFPCQPFSSVGKEEGFQDQRGNLFFEICRIIDGKRPAAIFLENVAGLETHDNGNTFRIIRDELESRGYHLKWIVADAQEYGFPQKRNRIYISGFLDLAAYEKYQFPEKTSLSGKIWDIIDRSKRAPDEYYLLPGTELYDIMNSAIRNEQEIYRISDGKYAVQGGVLSSRNGVAFTLLAGMGNWHDREPVIRDQWGLRKLTPRECFALQGYPKEFSLKGIPGKSAYREAGNTVCVPVVKQFAEKIILALASSRNKAEPSVVRILAGTVRNQLQLNIALQYQFYHFPKRLFHEEIDSVSWIGLNIPAWLDKNGGGIRYVGKIKKYDVVPRKSIIEIPRNSEEEYYRIYVENWIRPYFAEGKTAKGIISIITVDEKQLVSGMKKTVSVSNSTGGSRR